MKIIYIHGFNSSGQSEKAKLLRESFPEATVISPDFSPEPNEVMQELHSIIATDLQSTISVGTSLGGFYGTYLANLYSVPSFIVNPSLEPHLSLQSKIGKYNRYGTGGEYEFKSEYLDQLKILFEKIQKTDKEWDNMNFYIAEDDDELSFKKLDELYPKRVCLKYYSKSGHRFSRFSEIIPDIRARILQFENK